MNGTRKTLDLGIEGPRPYVPDFGSLVGFLNGVGALLGEVDLTGQFLDRTGTSRAVGEAWDMARASHAGGFLDLNDLRSVEPSHEVLGDLADVAMAALKEGGQKRRLSAVPFVEGEPAKFQVALGSSIDELKGDVRLGAVDPVVGDSRGTAAGAIVSPTVGQVEFAFEEGVEVPIGDAQMHRNNAIVRFAGGATILALDAGGFISLLKVGGLVDHSDGVGPAMGTLLDPPVDPRTHEIFVPTMQGEEFLEIPRMNAGIQRHRLYGLTRKRSQLTLDVGGDMPSSRRHRTVIKVFQESIQGGPQDKKRFRIHEFPLSNASPSCLSTRGAGELENFLSL